MLSLAVMFLLLAGSDTVVGNDNQLATELLVGAEPSVASEGGRLVLLLPRKGDRVRAWRVYDGLTGAVLDHGILGEKGALRWLSVSRPSSGYTTFLLALTDDLGEPILYRSATVTGRSGVAIPSTYWVPGLIGLLSGLIVFFVQHHVTGARRSMESLELSVSLLESTLVNCETKIRHEERGIVLPELVSTAPEPYRGIWSELASTIERWNAQVCDKDGALTVCRSLNERMRRPIKLK